MKDIINNQKNFVVLSLAWVIAGTFMLLTKTSLEWQQSLTGIYNGFFDFFFKYITYFGDGVVVVIIGLLFLLRSVRASALIISSYLISGLIVQVMKRFIFTEMHRPAYVFTQMGIDIYQVEGVVLRNHHAFPSGHTTSAFALFMSLSFILAHGRPLRQAILFFTAFLVAVSRVYLNQHFFIDVYYGALIGIVIAMALYVLFKPIRKEWFNQPAVKLVEK